jgi:hypothetical protein
MHKLQNRSTRNINKQGNMTHPKIHKSSLTKSKDIEANEMPGKEIKSQFLKNDQ